MDLSIIIVNWNSNSYLRDCLKSIENSQHLIYEVIVVDNNSKKNPKAIIDRFGTVRLIKNTKNLGFARSCNLGAKVATGRVLLFLNPDTKVIDNALKTLTDFVLIQKNIGAAGPKLLNPDFSIQKHSYYLKTPGIIQVVLFYTRLHRFSIKSQFLKEIFWEEDIGDSIKKVDQIPGAALAIKKTLFHKIGGFDSNYFLWFEDVDISFRLRKLGLELVYLPNAEIIHVGGGSFAKWDDEQGKRIQTLISLRLFFRKNKNFIEYILVNLILFFDKFL